MASYYLHAHTCMHFRLTGRFEVVEQLSSHLLCVAVKADLMQSFTSDTLALDSHKLPMRRWLFSFLDATFAFCLMFMSYTMYFIKFCFVKYATKCLHLMYSVCIILLWHHNRKFSVLSMLVHCLKLLYISQLKCRLQKSSIKVWHHSLVTMMMHWPRNSEPTILVLCCTYEVYDYLTKDFWKSVFLSKCVFEMADRIFKKA